MLVKNTIIERYLKARADIALGIQTGRVDPILGQNWLDINEARMQEAKNGTRARVA